MAVKNWQTPGEKKQVPGNWWLSHPRRREYSALDFNPSGVNEGEYNLWQGFPVTAQKGDCHLFWKFVEEVICAGNKKLYEYLRRYMAHMIQRPGELPEIALVQRGGQGTGKNTFVETMGKLVAPCFKEASSMDQLTGRFNSQLMQCILLHANEAYWGGNKTDAGRLKAMITSPTITIEQKGVDVFSIRNCVRTIVSSNEDWPVPIDTDDRRYLVLDVSDCHKQDKTYFGDIHAELNNGGLEALMFDLLHENLQGYHPRDAPRSPFGADMKIRSADSVTRWLFECLQEGYLQGQPVPFGDNRASQVETWPTSIARSVVGLYYSTWCRSQNERYPERDTVYYKKLRRLLPEIKDTRPSATDGVSRQRCLVFPSLESARKSFEKSINAIDNIVWENE